MVDDIDDLLDEVELKFCNDNERGKGKSSKVNTVKSKPIQVKSKLPDTSSEDIDNIIDDIIADDGLDKILKKNICKPSSSKKVEGTMPVRCFSIFVGGTISSFGVATTTNKRSCDQIHCTSCDNQVVSFADFKWDDCDYLDFRNNYPDFERLRSKLISRKGSRAYCCQCSWLDVSDLKELKTFKPSLKWVCRKH